MYNFYGMNYNLKMNFSIPFTATTTCPKICRFTMSNKNSNGTPRGLNIQLIFNDRNKTELEACSNEKRNQGFREIYINCSSWNKGTCKLYNIQNLIVTCMYTCFLISFNYAFKILFCSQKLALKLTLLKTTA